MVRQLFTIIVIATVFAGVSAASDLYKVAVSSHDDARKLLESGAEAVALISGGYLVLADEAAQSALLRGGLKIEHLASDIEKDELALEISHGPAKTAPFPLLYEAGGFRLYRAGADKGLQLSDGSSLAPIDNSSLKIMYRQPMTFNPGSIAGISGLQELIDQVNYDTVYSQLHHLQAFNGRVAGTSSNYAARDWLRGKLQSYGYANAHTEWFDAWVNGAWVNCYNVVASKTGTKYPNRQIVIGAHFDAVPGSPGVDDNGTGTVGVLECARILATTPTEMSVVFILFDSEEQGLNGAFWYAGSAASRGDSIIVMLNMDMIGNVGNFNFASLYYGPQIGYAELWGRLADSLVGIAGILSGMASNSDHYAFIQAGYDAVFSNEYQFSGVYHSPYDSTAYIGWDYYNRMIKANLATAYTVSEAPLPVRTIAVRDGGDGQSLRIDWHPAGAGTVTSYRVHYDTNPSTGLDSITVPATDSGLTITGLILGVTYNLAVVAIDSEGQSSVIRPTMTGVPRIIPVLPTGLSALPRYRSVQLVWKKNNSELDFSHYAVMRDGQMVATGILDTAYLDDDFDLGVAFHAYIVIAVDDDGNKSDTVGVVPVRMRAASLSRGRILAVNRSINLTPYIVNEVVTGEFMRDALAGYDFDYLSDTASASGSDSLALNLVDMLDYELVVIGAESGRRDDLGAEAVYGGKLDSIGYYLDLGGKVIIFGRWGNLGTGGKISDTVYYNPTFPDYGYRSYFHLVSRVQYLTTYSPTTLNSDLRAGISTLSGYPNLTWDSLATVNHSAPWVQASGIPCPSFGILESGTPEIIYTYDSRSNFPLTEGKPVGWRYLGLDYQYVMFNVPLSFMIRSQANAAMQKAVSDLLSAGPSATMMSASDTLNIPGGTPATVTLYLGDFMPSKTATDVDLATIRVNGGVIPSTTAVIPSHPPFVGEVVEVTVPLTDFTAPYGVLVDTTDQIYAVYFNFTGESNVNFLDGQITIIGYSFLRGDVNGDNLCNVADAVYMINHIFKGGPAPEPLAAGDPNCDARVNVGDAVHLINYVFKSGPPPGPSVCP